MIRLSKSLLLRHFYLLISLLLLLSALYVAYEIYVFPRFSYAGFIRAPDAMRAAEAILAVTLGALVLPVRLTRASHFLLHFFFASVIVPTLCLYVMRSDNRGHLLTMLLGFFIVLLISRVGPTLQISLLRNTRRVALWGSIAVLFAVIAQYMLTGGFANFNLNLLRVYEFRPGAAAASGSGIMGLLNIWGTKVIGPSLLAWALWQRRYGAASMILTIQVLLFAVSHNRAVLLYPFLILGTFLLQRFRAPLLWIPLGVAAVISAGTLHFLVSGDGILISLLVRRAMFVPAQMNFAYYSLFDAIGHTFLSNSFLGTWIDYPFNVPYQLLVGEYLQNELGMWANNGFLATGYMHFGVLGIIIYSIIVGALLKIVDSIATNRMSPWLAIAMIIVPFSALFRSADLTTALWTHGLLLSIIMLAAIASSSNSKHNKKRKLLHPIEHAAHDGLSSESNQVDP